jgi:hypothetical protein
MNERMNERASERKGVDGSRELNKFNTLTSFSDFMIVGKFFSLFRKTAV